MDSQKVRFSRTIVAGLPLWFLLLALAGLALRLALLLQYLRSPFGRAPLGDERYYWIWAEGLAAGTWHREGVFYQGPLYPYLLAAIKAAWGGFGQGALAAVQLLLNWMTCLLLLPLTTAWTGRPRALAGAALALFFSPAVFFALKGLPTTVGLFFLILGLVVLCAGSRWGELRAAIAGPLIGLAFLAVPSFLAAAPGIALAAALAAPKGKRPTVLLALLLGTAAVIFPVSYHNYRADGSLILISSSSGMVFAQGNNPRGDGTYSGLDGISSLAGQQALDAERIVRHETGRRVTHAEVSHHFFRRGLTFIREQPGRWILLELRKTALLLAGLDVPLEFSQVRERRDFLPLLWAFPVNGTIAVVLGLCVMGSPGSARPAWVPVLIGVFLGLSCLVFFVSGRHALPAYFLLLPAAPAGLQVIRDRSCRWRIGAALLLVSGSLAYAIPVLSAPSWEGDDYLLKLAGVYERQDRPLDALATYRQWMDISPHSPLLFRKLAEFYLRQGQPQDAEDYARRSVALNAGDPAAKRILARVFLDTGRADAAVVVLEPLVAADDLDVRARLLLADAYKGTGRREEAMAVAEQALALDPASEAVHHRLEELRKP